MANNNEPDGFLSNIMELTDEEVTAFQNYLFGNGPMPGVEVPVEATKTTNHQDVIDEVNRRLAEPSELGRGHRTVVRSSPYERPVKQPISSTANEFFKTIWMIMRPRTEFIASDLNHYRTKKIILQIYKERS